MGLLREPDHWSNPPTGRLIVKSAYAAQETKGAILTDRATGLRPIKDRIPAGCAADSAGQCPKTAYEPPIDQAKPDQMKIPVAIAIMIRTANVRPFLRTVGTTGSPAKTRVFMASPHPNHAAQI